MGNENMFSRMWKPPRHSIVSRNVATKHDDSGQVFTEVLCSGGPMIADWVWKTKGSSREMGTYRSIGPGCSSLINMAIRSVLYNLYGITTESLAGLPWEVAVKVWQRLVDSQLDSVQVWKAFACAYPLEANMSLKSKHKIIERPNMRLADYIKPVTSPKFNWITFLTLANITCPRTDVIQISQLQNLGVLTLGQNLMAEGGGLDDSIIRTWARIAKTSDAFSMLRVLSLRSQNDISPLVFNYLNDFPALAVFNIEDCNLDHRIEHDVLICGWGNRTRKSLSDWLVQGGAKGASWDAVMHAYFTLGGTYSTQALTAEGVEAVDALPRLHLSLGGFPQNANVDERGRRGLKSFYRIAESIMNPLDKVKTGDKRVLDQARTNSAKRRPHKPTMRASKQQNMADILGGFGG